MYQLVPESDPILRKKAEPWLPEDLSPNELIAAMTTIMFQNNGIGLAAPQIGVSKAILIMGNPDKVYACINPEIISGEGEVKDIEGCLSFPKLWLHVKRSTKIKVRYTGITGELIECEFEGLLARVFQHELSHLNGELFTEKVSDFQLKRALRKRMINNRAQKKFSQPTT
jgi:peptide deformylase